MLNDQTIGFLGAGSMAEAIISGLLDKQLLPAKHIIVTNRTERTRLQQLENDYGIQTTTDHATLVSQSDILILAMKPKDVSDIQQNKASLREDQLILSVLAGISTDHISQLLGRPIPVIRAMPNTSSAVGCSATGLAAGAHVRPNHLETAQTIFQSIGKAAVVDEDQMDIVTGLAGSGPAFIYSMIEAMEEAGIQGGLDPQTTKTLARQTLFGVAQMLQQTGKEPEELRQKIMSPGGTTVAGLDTLQSNGFTESVQAAVHRSAERAEELGKKGNA